MQDLKPFGRNVLFCGTLFFRNAQDFFREGRGKLPRSFYQIRQGPWTAGRGDVSLFEVLCAV